MIQVIVLFLVLLLPSGNVLAQKTDVRLIESVQDAFTIRQDTQKQEDQWAREKATLEEKCQSAEEHIRALQKQQRILGNKNVLVSKKIKDLKRNLEESESVEAGLQATMEGILDDLDQFVKSDLPFLPDERAKRVRNLRALLASADTAAPEKLRRLLEALKVECEYGESVEVVPETIHVQGETLNADILRLGRLALFWKTPDGKQVGEFDPESKQWVELPGKYKRNILRAMEMAKGTRPSELIKMPVGRLHP